MMVRTEVNHFVAVSIVSNVRWRFFVTPVLEKSIQHLRSSHRPEAVSLPENDMIDNGLI
jgi:hypothetical protein